MCCLVPSGSVRLSVPAYPSFPPEVCSGDVMQQRELRLGDILDDYCPRERRITNHAIVAMVGPEVKQTRCTTCDAEHVYKRAKIPPQRKKKDAKAVLYDQVLASVAKVDGNASGSLAAASPALAAPAEATVAVVRPEPEAVVEGTAKTPAAGRTEEEGRLHRPLIRATLPRTEGQPAPRQAPEFTIRQAGGHQGKVHGSHPGGARHTDHQKGRGHASHGAGSRAPGTRLGSPSHHSGRPGHSPHATGTQPGHHPHQSRHSHTGAMARPGKKRSR